MTTPKYLYKILAYSLWQDSLGEKKLLLPEEDKTFIRLHTHEQLARTLLKSWAQIPKYMVLKIDPKQLVGELVLETAPKGTTKYYHLYNGSIPLKAIIEWHTHVRKC